MTPPRDPQLTPEQVGRLRQLHEAATPGPWLTAPWDPKTLMVEGWVLSAKPSHPAFEGPFGIFHAGTEGDAALAAAALSALPDLLDAVERRPSYEAIRDVVHQTLTGKPYDTADWHPEDLTTSEDIARAVLALLRPEGEQ